jgi:hypothetical protein
MRLHLGTAASEGRLGRALNQEVRLKNQESRNEHPFFFILNSNFEILNSMLRLRPPWDTLTEQRLRLNHADD